MASSRIVVPGLVPGIHVVGDHWKESLDGTSSAKTRFALLPGHDESEAAATLARLFRRDAEAFA
jgi:hypothetical protein